MANECQLLRAMARDVGDAIQSRASLVGVAALFYLSGAMDAEAQPVSDDQAPTTQQAPTPQTQQAPQPTGEQPETPSPAQQSEQPRPGEPKADVPLPTVSVEATRQRRPARTSPAPAAPAVTSPPPPATATTNTTAVPSAPALGATPYQVSNTGITRLPVPIINMPQTVNVVPQQIIQEQRITTVEDALRYIPGITFSAGEGGQQGDAPIIRGFVARGDLFRDGIRDPGWYTRDAFSIDRVEVYKGPSAFAFGRGATGGAINY